MKEATKVLEEAIERQKEEESLSPDLANLPREVIINIAIKERFQAASLYHTYRLRKLGLEATMKMTIDDNAIENQRSQIELLNTEMQHCLRLIRVIDKEYPEAKGE